MYLPKALQCMATMTLRSKSLNEEGAIVPDEVEEKGCTHSLPPKKTGIRVTTSKPLGLASYTISIATTTRSMEEVSIYL